MDAELFQQKRHGRVEVAQGLRWWRGFCLAAENITVFNPLVLVCLATIENWFDGLLVI